MLPVDCPSAFRVLEFQRDGVFQHFIGARARCEQQKQSSNDGDNVLGADDCSEIFEQ